MMQEKTWAEDRREQLTAKKTQKANTLKRCTTSLVIRKKQITIIRHYFLPVRLGKIQKLNSNYWKRCEGRGIFALGWTRGVHFGTTTSECNLEASNRV